jgi:hypothetical protein
MAIISFSSRYVTVKTFLKADLYRTLLGILAFLGILGIVLSYVAGFMAGPSWRDGRNLRAYYLSTYKVQSDENMRLLFPWDSHTAIEGAEILEKYRLNVFSKPSLDPEQLTLVEASTQFHIDSINNNQLGQQGNNTISISQQEETLTILGWAIDQQAQNTAGGVFVCIDGRINIPALYGLNRPDVAQALHNGRYRSSGFLASFATSVLGEGQHTLSMKIVTSDKKGYYEPDQNIVIEVK